MRICTGGVGFVGIRRHDLVRSVGDVISNRPVDCVVEVG